MPIDTMKNVSFSPASEQTWKDKVEESLKGKKFESLIRDTYENIILKPLYSIKDNNDSTEYPGGTNYRRGIYALGYHSKPWKIAQKVTFQTAVELRENLSSAFERGQTAIAFSMNNRLYESIDRFEEILTDFYGKFPLAIETNGFQKQILSSLSKMRGNETISGYAAEDPLSVLVRKGSLPFTMTDYLQNLVENINTANKDLPQLKTILIDTTPYHNGGANAVQELSIALATGVYYLEELKDRSIEVETLFEKLIFKFQIGANFFMELAKLRAARVLWDKIGEAYGIPSANRRMEIIAETSTFTKTLYDPHVNILRSGNEAFAAILGGVQYLHVNSFNELEGITPLAERLARNTQLILKEESFLQNIVDPAGGSWYIESLTSELVKNAWEYFLSMEDKGGIMQALESNWLQTEIAEVLKKRRQDVFTRKQSIVGTNVYANLQERLKEQVQNEENIFSLKEQKEFHHIQPIKSQRLAEPFEALRHRAHHLDRNQVGLICLGELKQFKPRADFMTGFLSAAGLEGVRNEGGNSFEDILSFISETGLRHYVLCSSNEIYNEIGLDIFKKLMQSHLKVQFYLAGLPDKEVQDQWNEAGIRDYIHLKTNCYEFNSSIISELEEVEHHE